MTATLAFNGLMKRTKLGFFMKNYPIEAQIVFVDEDGLGRHTWLVHFAFPQNLLTEAHSEISKTAC